jgi:YVTN family beta-propeller protein
MTMSPWRPRSRTIGIEIILTVFIVLVVLSQGTSAPFEVLRSGTGSGLSVAMHRPARATTGTEELSDLGQTSLGPPGNEPTGIAYDNRTGEMFVVESPWYLAILNGSPPSLVDSVFLGQANTPESLAVDTANDTVFVGSYPSTVLVVSGASREIVAELSLQVNPTFLAYDPATGDVYTGAGNQNFTSINGTTYAVSSMGLAGFSGFEPLAFAYDPITNHLVLMGIDQCLCFFITGEVLGIDATTGNSTWETSGPPDGYTYTGMAIDSANGSVYLTTSDGAAIVLNGSNGMTLADFGFPGGTDCGLLSNAEMAYDTSSADVLVGECGGVVRSIDTVNDTVGPPVLVGGMPAATAVDPRSGAAYVLNWDTNSVAVLTATGSKVLGYLVVGGAPEAVAVDSSTGTAYVLASNNVSIINLSTHTRAGSIALGVNSSSLSIDGAEFSPYVWASPQSILYDPLSQEVFVANSGNNTVSVVSTGTNEVIGTVPVAQSPLALAWNNETNEIYAACSGLLDVISAATLRVEANISLGGLVPGGVAFVPSLNEIFVDTFSLQGTTPQLTIISAATNSTVGSISLPSNETTAGEIVYDNSTGDLYVAGAWLGLYLSGVNDFIVNPTAKTFVGNISVGTDPDAIAPDLGTSDLFATAGANGTVSFVNGVTGAVLHSTQLASDSLPQGVAYDPSTSQALVTDWGSDAVSYLTVEEGYPVTFSETGLPNGTSWSVTLNRSMNSSATSTVGFLEPNGTSHYEIGAVSGYTATPTSGDVTVNGTNVTVALQFTPPPLETYSVDFTESGLAPGTRWSVDFNNTTQQSGGSAVIFGDIPNGTYSFTVIPASNYNVTPGTGFVTVAGANAGRDIVFTEIHVPLVASINWTTVSGTGLCGGGPFSVTVQFFGNATGGNSPYTFSWNFSDNASTSTSQNPRYTYTTGPYVAGLTVKDSRGATTTKSVTLLFASSCPPSMATFGDALPVITLVVSLILAVSVGALAHRVTRVKSQVK